MSDGPSITINLNSDDSGQGSGFSIEYSSGKFNAQNYKEQKTGVRQYKTSTPYYFTVPTNHTPTMINSTISDSSTVTNGTKPTSFITVTPLPTNSKTNVTLNQGKTIF